MLTIILPFSPRARAYITRRVLWPTYLGVGERETSDREETFSQSHDKVLRNLPQYAHGVLRDVCVLGDDHLRVGERWG